MSGAFEKTSFNIRFMRGERGFPLPHATDDARPLLRWDVPKGVGQRSFIVEMRTFNPVRLSTGEFMCAYLSSSRIVDSRPEYRLFESLSPDTWAGLCEVRIRVFDAEGNEFCSHGMTGETYDFERSHPQFRKWGTRNDGCYFVFDPEVNSFVNQEMVSCRFRKAMDDDSDQSLSYDLQVSETPLFDEGEMRGVTISMNGIPSSGGDVRISVPGAFAPEGEDSGDKPDKPPAPPSLDSLKSGVMYFFRVRSFDGYDYSEWSVVNAFCNTFNDPPRPRILSVRSEVGGDFTDRPGGEVLISARIDDPDHDFVSAGLFFSMRTTKEEADRIGCQENDSDDAADYETEMSKETVSRLIPCGVVGSLAKVPANREFSVTWMSGRHIVNAMKDSVYLYLVAFDEYAEGRDVGGPFRIDNSSIGDVNSAVGSSPESFPVTGDMGLCLWYPAIPADSRRSAIGGLLPPSPDAGKMVTMSWDEWLGHWRSDVHIGERGGVGTYSIYCPECAEMTLLEMRLPEGSGEFVFVCPRCGRSYPQDIMFGDLAFASSGRIMTDCYSYWHGYASSASAERRLEDSLLLMRKTEFDDMVRICEEETGKKYAGRKFFEIPFLRDGRMSGGYSAGIWGFLGDDALLGLSPRPAVGPYGRVRCPRTKVRHYAVYMDGPGLKMDVDDYMHDFEPMEPDESGQGGKPGDPDMMALAKQSPWNCFLRLCRCHADVASSGSDSRKPFVYGMEDHCVESETATVTSFENGGPADSVRTTLWWLPCETVSAYFGISIRRGVNDRYRIEVNGEVRSGSVMDFFPGMKSLYIDYPYSDGRSNHNLGKYLTAVNGVLGDAFRPVREESPWRISGLIENRPGFLSFRAVGSHDARLSSVRLLPVSDMDGRDLSCYSALGLRPFECGYAHLSFMGRMGEQVRLSGFEGSSERYYQESSEDGAVSDKRTVDELPPDDRMDFWTGGEADGEPLFTCDPDEVDSRGFHFRFSEEEYRRTGRIYVRTFRFENALPFPDGGFGYRDWETAPAGRTGRFVRRRVLSRRGLPAEIRRVLARPPRDSVGDADWDSIPPVEEDGFFAPGAEHPFSHRKPKKEHEGDPDPVPMVYERTDGQSWRSEMEFRRCRVFYYVDMSEALCKNFLDAEAGRSPFNRKAPIAISAGIERLRHGIYVMGQYALTAAQRKYTLYGDAEDDGTDGYDLNAHWFSEIGDFNSDSLESESRRLSCVAFRGSGFAVCPGCGRAVSGGFVRPDGVEMMRCGSCGEEFERPVRESFLKEQDSFGRYRSAWLPLFDPNAKSDSDFAVMTVEQFFPRFFGVCSIYRKYGYEPEHCLSPYWKDDEDGTCRDTYIPDGNSMVHGVRREGCGDFRGRGLFVLQKKLISDRSFTACDDADTVRGKYLDYRIEGMNAYDERRYFSGLPKDEHPAYGTRPDVVYRHDRPWRIVGEIDDEKPYSKWSFVYLQPEWNAYNRVHWQVDQDESTYLCLYASDVTGGSTSGRFSVRTRRSVWVDEFSAWCIPYAKDEESDTIDMLNGNRFADGHRYQFSMTAVNRYNGTVSGTEVTSIRFVTSRSAVSPATVTATEYDPWTGILKVKFRFDDALGRKYDVTGFRYSVSDPDLSAGDSPDGTWRDVELGALTGRLIGLESNTTGDDVPSRDMIVEHQVSVDVKGLEGVTATDELRVRIVADLAAFREGFTLPLFSARTWANEFINPADKAIIDMEGCYNRWVWTDRVGEDGELESGWEYVPEDKAVFSPGKIAVAENAMREIDDAFEKWYSENSRFEMPDADAFECYLISSGKFDSMYYGDAFDSYLAERGLADSYAEYRSSYAHPIEGRTRRGFLASRALERDFGRYHMANRFRIMTGFMSGNGLSVPFMAWFSRIRAASRKSLAGRFVSEGGHDAEYAEWRASHGAGMADADAMAAFAVERHGDGFEAFFRGENSHLDTRFSERGALIDAEGFSAWLSSPVDKDGLPVSFDYLPEGADYSGDQRYLYLELSGRQSVRNSGKCAARVAFMRMKRNGIAYGDTYQSLADDLGSYRKVLSDAYATRSRYETEHRAGLIAQGYFCNGFEDNVPFAEDGSVNTCFRFRVETQIYDGKKSDHFTHGMDDRPEEGVELDLSNGYRERFDMYYRFQLDFYGSFDSQTGGRPLRDILFVRGPDGSPRRIKADTPDADMSAATTHESRLDEEVTERAPGGLSDYQKYAEWAIPKSELPGELPGDELPEYWSRDGSFEHVYFWRVAPYNVVRRPVIDGCLGSCMEVSHGGEVHAEGIYDNEWRYHASVSLHRHSTVVSNRFFSPAVMQSSLEYERRRSGYAQRNSFYVWCASGRLAAPEWRSNPHTAAGSRAEGMGLPNPVLSSSPYANPWIDLRAASEGLVQFVTDRPREVISENGVRAVRFVRDGMGNFDMGWIPFGTERMKPCVIRTDAGYAMLCSKRTGQGYADGKPYAVSAITLSLGTASDIFGEERSLFPRYSTESPSSVIPGALSFDSPFAMRTDSGYRIYFNALFHGRDGFRTETWTASSDDLRSWEGFVRCSFAHGDAVSSGVSDPFVTAGPDGFSCYAVSLEKGEAVAGIHRWSSADGLSFKYDSQICGELYEKSRPCLVRRDESDAGTLYFSMRNGSGRLSMIFSLDLNDESPYPRIEKGGGDWDMGTFGTDDRFENPFVLMDSDHLTPALRMYYNRPAAVRAWENGSPADTEFTETAIATDFLEEYEWERTDIRNWLDSSNSAGGTRMVPCEHSEDGGMTWSEVPMDNAGWDAEDYPIPANSGLIRFSWLSESPSVLAFKAYPSPLNRNIPCLSQGAWIGFSNVGETEATLRPEGPVAGYDRSAFPPSSYIRDEGLAMEYDKWRSESGSQLTGEESAAEFLLVTYRYPDYLGKSLRGPGVYRYLRLVRESSYGGE